MSERLRLGDMLVAAGLVTEAQVEEALDKQRAFKQRLGETLVTLGHVTESQMMQVLSNQLSLPWVDLYHVDFSRELLALVPAALAEAHRLVPVYVRHVRRHGDTLYVALDDPLNFDALQAAADATGLPVKPMLASSTDIKNAIRVYYLGLPPLQPEPEDPELIVSEGEPLSVPPPAEPASTEASATRSKPRPAEPPPSASPPPAEAAEAPSPEEKGPRAVPSMPPPPRAALAFRTLTLLDGTTVRLPAPGKTAATREPEPARALTTRDLIHALTARAAGEDVRDMLPDDAWEPLFAALLSVLLRKGLVADWEFVDEWNKQRTKNAKKP